ncbi:hypothetical protein GCM10011425_29770 [Mucilaginibacter galii]|uniref:DUF2971 domain-containing protein n=1 Tax=Mucilaginibacter galii TaxID=2005073 RepID=A0A917JC74_9SPHI|nr:DUF2971 domain-containing protein [Mucilaginibacter galii]GGI51765.1 hypothetical protein GCM10011425_29770 [Mucilaginibacter galii]
MNDPREAHDWTFGSTNVPYEKLFPAYYSDQTHIDCQFRFGKMVKDRFQVICFSGAQRKGWDNEMMWAHYADRQTGVCLEFDEEALKRSIDENFPGTRFEIQDVNYEQQIRNRDAWVYWDESVPQEQNLTNFLEQLSRKVTFYKSHFWEKEDEKRLLFLNHTNRLFVPILSALKAVHIGLNIPKKEHEAIFQAVKEKGIKLYVMVYQSNRYERWNLSKKEEQWWTSKD